MTQVKKSPQGWDSKTIAEIANRCYGSYEEMFETHDWPERGSDMMQKVQTRVTDTYGCVAEFANQHENRE